MMDATIINAINRLLPEEERVADGLSVGAVKWIMEHYPYFSFPAAMLLRENSDSLNAEDCKMLSQYVARTAVSPIVLSAILNQDDAPFYPDEVVATPSTESAIDTFLSTYGNGAEDDEVLNRLIFNPTPDYAQLLAQEEQANLPSATDGRGDSHDDLLNRFIIKQKQQEGSAPVDTPSRIPASTVENRHNDDNSAAGQPTENSLLSESLAKIFIRQRQYERAYEIISQLSLNYPEKSVYFADQMRFLRKVINNRRWNANETNA